ncbi:uncharacterized protein LOC5575152 isoform X2 [Aedes aegypti]|uniref:Uncharacterized protein n=1 Tax=Aedes aegypti TaxID=7159 RepID=A0A6I8TWR1_AEDAE|nr:uncharacterized protein LOC5575152 isoform X2 [Aedes aegypti]
MEERNPIVLVLSADASTEPESLIAKVRKIPSNENQQELAEGRTGYRYHIRTKYYETDVLLCPWRSSEELCDLPEEILKQMDGILIYFDAKDREFLKVLPDYAAFVTDTGIEFGILLCSELAEESDKGITFKEAKQYCNVLDVIELEPSGETEEGEAAGVDELVQAMHNFIWSNVDMNRKSGAAENGGGGEGGGNSEETASADDELRIEEELMGFEKLLTQVMQFRPNTSSWTRNERLAYAQEFAEIFDDLIGDEDGDV